MSEKPNQDKAGFIKLVLNSVESDSESKEAARAFLADEGLDPDRIVSDGLKRIKQLQLMISAQQTQAEMNAAENVKQKAIDWVTQLLSRLDISFHELVQREGIQVSFSNVEELSQDDIKNILIKHFTLKFASNPDDATPI